MSDIKDFERIILEVKPRIYRYCFYQLKNSHWADEAWQLFMIVMNRKWESLVLGDKFDSYCIKVANNCIKQVRDKNLRYYSKYESFEALSETGLISEASVTDTYFDEADDQKNIERIANTLPDNVRQLFIYRHIEGKTLNEISDITGIPYSTVRTRLNRIEQRVRKEIKKIFK